MEAEDVVPPCWYNLDLHPGNRPRLTQRRATKVNLGLDRSIGKVKWAVCLLGSEAQEKSETCATYHYGTLRGTLQQTYPLLLKGFGTAQAQEVELHFVVELLQ